MDIEKREQYYERMIQRLEKFLTLIQCENGEYPDVTNYGYTFSALFGVYRGLERNRVFVDRALRAHERQDREDFNYPWEFNNYALLKLREKAPGLVSAVDWRQNKGTRVTNWKLLRIVNAYRATRRGKALVGLVPVVLRSMRKDALIRDERFLRSCTRSFQYHTFSAALLGELFVLSGVTIIGKLFLRAIYFIADKVFENGRSLYLGRGQEQIFGYSSLLYCLELAHKLTQNKIFAEKATKILDFLNRYQRRDGSFPLVLSGAEFKKGLLSVDSKPPGWYSYNTLFDYLPFMGVFLCRALELRQQRKFKGFFKTTDNRISNTNDIIHKSHSVYEYCYAVPTGGKGNYNDEQPIPFIVTKRGRHITPIYGGDATWTELYSPFCIPLPYGLIETSVLKKNRLLYVDFWKNIKMSHWCYRNWYDQNSWQEKRPYFFANQLKYSRNNSSGFIGLNKWIRYERKFLFENDTVQVYDTVAVKSKMRFSAFYPVNLFMPLCKIDKKEHDCIELESESADFKVRIAPVTDKIVIARQAAPLGELTWVREAIQEPRHRSFQREMHIQLI